MTKSDYDIQPFTTKAAFAAWMVKNHATCDGLWVKMAKKTSGLPTVTYAEALDVALCYGWIDGQAKTVDDTFYMQKFTPRRAKSMWSQINRGHVARLIKAGKMQPAGQAQIDAAKADGRWDAAYDSPTNIQMSDDFKQALAANPKAKAFYETLNKTNTYAFLWRIATAKRPETRAARIKKLIAMLANGEKFH
jgi:uncharacterized protein YdeI (YjbR/CyaY-like superfamily)